MVLNFTVIQEEKNRIYESYVNSFPENERRNEKEFWELFHHPNARVLSIYKDNEMVGYLIIWELSEFIFIEHFEVFEKFRNQKLGTKIIENISVKFGNIILETEPSNFNEVAERRVKFYERNKFSVLKKDYIQPKYAEDKEDLNLWLMGNFPIENLQSIIGEIYRVVYGVE